MIGISISPAALRYAAIGGGGGGSYSFDLVSLLLHFEGPEGSQTFTDSSPRPKTVTPNVTPPGDSPGIVITDAKAKYGLRSCYVQYYDPSYLLEIANHADFNFTGDFSIEFSMKFGSQFAAGSPIIGRWGGGGVAEDWLIIYTQQKALQFWANGALVAETATFMDSGLFNQIISFGIFRFAETLIICRQGVVVATGSLAGPIQNSGLRNVRLFRIDDASASAYSVHLDELRIVKYAMQTGDYTVSAEQFPDA